MRELHAGGRPSGGATARGGRIGIGRRAALAGLLAGLVLLAFLAWIYAWPRPRYVPILVYHSVIPEAEMSGSNPAVVSLERFSYHLRYLKRHGYEGITMEQLRAFLGGDMRGLPRKPVVIAFDDGYADSYTYAWPALEAAGFRAVISVIVKEIDAASSGQTPTSPLLYLTWDQLAQMTSSGVFEVGSHTYDCHREVATDVHGTPGPALVSPQFLWDKGWMESDSDWRNRIEADLAQSRDEIAAHLGRAPSVIAYPYGVSNATVDALAAESGFSIGLSTTRGFVLPGDDPMRLRRLTILEKDGFPRFVLKLSPLNYPWQLTIRLLAGRDQAKVE